jgi:hypothetical protein
MWHISVILCLLSVGEQNLDMCFKTEVPARFNSYEECNVVIDNIVAYSNEDLIQRNSSLIMKCLPLGSANV